MVRFCLNIKQFTKVFLKWSVFTGWQLLFLTVYPVGLSLTDKILLKVYESMLGSVLVHFILLLSSLDSKHTCI